MQSYSSSDRGRRQKARHTTEAGLLPRPRSTCDAPQSVASKSKATKRGSAMEPPRLECWRVLLPAACVAELQHGASSGSGGGGGGSERRCQ